MSNLHTLHVLGEVPLTDAGLSDLKNLTTLRELQVTSSTITAAGVASLQAALPMCQITVNPTIQKALDELRNRKAMNELRTGK